MPFQQPDSAPKEGNRPNVRRPVTTPVLEAANLELSHSAAQMAAVMNSNSTKNLIEQFRAPRNPVQSLENNINKIYQGLGPFGEPEQKIKTEIKYFISKLAESFLAKSKFSSMEKNLLTSEIIANGLDNKDTLNQKWIIESVEFPLKLLGVNDSKSRVKFNDWLVKASELPSKWSKGFVSYEERPRDDDREMPIAPSPLTLQAAFDPLARHYFFNVDQIKIDTIVKAAQNSVVRLGGAAGFVIGRDGLTVTAGHVVERLVDLRNQPNRRQTLSGDQLPNIIYSHHKEQRENEFDLGILQVAAYRNRAPLKIRTTPISPTEPLILVGYPKAESETKEINTPPVPLRFSVGTLFELSSSYTVASTNDLRTHILTDNENRRGNSGGPLLDLEGRVVGVLVSPAFLDVSKYEAVKWPVTAGLSVPASEILRVLKAKGISLPQ